jgi:hypothetical protein
MPRVSPRRQLIADRIRGLAVACLDEEDDEDFLLLDGLFDLDGEVSLNSLFGMEEELWMDTPIDDLAEVLILVEGSRYLSLRQRYAKSRDFVTNYFLRLPDESFRQLTRMSKALFRFMLSEIEGHHVFTTTAVIRKLSSFCNFLLH